MAFTSCIKYKTTLHGPSLTQSFSTLQPGKCSLHGGSDRRWRCRQLTKISKSGDGQRRPYTVLDDHSSVRMLTTTLPDGTLLRPSSCDELRPPRIHPREGWLLLPMEEERQSRWPLRGAPIPPRFRLGHLHVPFFQPYRCASPGNAPDSRHRHRRSLFTVFTSTSEGPCGRTTSDPDFPEVAPYSAAKVVHVA